MFANLLIGLREGLEAALIVSMLLAALARMGRAELRRQIWLGVGAGAGLSVVIGALLYFTVGEMPAPADQIVAGSLSLLAVVMLTGMVFWMARNSAGLRNQVSREVEAAVSGTSAALVLLAFTAVAREGLETALYLWAGFTATTSGSDASALLGGLVGIAIAVAIGWAFYRGALRLNLRKLFLVSGYALLVVGAGVLTYAIGEFQEIGWLPGANALAFDISAQLPADGLLATLLRGFLNFHPSMSVLQVVGWFSFVLPAVAMFGRVGKVKLAAK